MSSDIFGNLREWENIPSQITTLAKEGKLDEHQAGLIRILRYRENWKLRELVLKSVKNLTAPSNELLTEILNIIENEEIYWETRLLALRAIRELLEKKNTVDEEKCQSETSNISKRIRSCVESAGPPILQDSMRDCVKHRVRLCGLWNIPGSMPVHASWLYAHNILHYVENLFKNGLDAPDYDDAIVRHSLVTHQGKIVHQGMLKALKKQ